MPGDSTQLITWQRSLQMLTVSERVLQGKVSQIKQVLTIPEESIPRYACYQANVCLMYFEPQLYPFLVVLPSIDSFFTPLVREHLPHTTLPFCLGQNGVWLRCGTFLQPPHDMHGFRRSAMSPATSKSCDGC